MNKFEINPFDRSALRDFKLLAGRNNEFRQLRFLLRNASNQENRIKSIIISGDRGVGKTSFLNLIEIECSANNIIPIRLNLTETNSNNSNEFFWYLFNQTINKIFEIGFLGGIGGDVYNAIQKIIIADGISDMINWFFKTPILRKNYLINRNSDFEFDLLVEDLKLIRKQVTSNNTRDEFNSKTKFLFLVDESQIIYTNTKIIEEIRYIIQNSELGFGFVFAGDRSFEKAQWDVVFGGSHREFEIINLDYFEEVECIKEYFRKSLESIGWTTKEIEEELFYRFHRACGQIYALTSGKPAWINEIAQKMFERCMKGESDILRFDRNAQNDVKIILLNTGQIDSVKLDFIDSLSPKYQNWLSKIFASEYSSLNQVYFYSKFILSDSNFLTIDEYRDFCKKLLEEEIIIIEPDNENKHPLGFSSITRKEDFLDKPFIALGDNSESFKLWLQINTDSKYLFAILRPDLNFTRHINSELTCESGDTFLFVREKIGNTLLEEIRISKLIERITNNTLDINETPYNIISVLYRLIKRLENSKKGQVLYIQLKDNISSKILAWNIYNTNEHDQLIGFYNNKTKIERFKSVVESYNNEEQDYILEIEIDELHEINFERFQNSIIKSGDAKKRSIVIEDKMNALYKYYIDEHNIELSYNVACFIYKIYEEGHDLSVRHLNNTSYVFLMKNEIEKANALLNEAIKKINNQILERDELGSALLALYNSSIVAFKESQYEKTFRLLKMALSFWNDNNSIDDFASALLIIVHDDREGVILKEIQANETNNNSIKISTLVKENISVLENYFNSVP